MDDETREETANDRAGTPGPRWSKRRIALVFFLLVLTLAGYNFFVDCDPPVVPELVLPTGTNGWEALVEARELFPTDVEPIEYVPDEEEPTYTELMTLTDYDTEIALRPEHRAIVETWLANADEIEARIDLALSHDVIRRPNGSTHPHVISVSKDLSRWLVLRAHLAAGGGKPREVIRQVERVHSLSDKSLESHPNSLTFLVANALKSIANQTLEGLLPVEDEAVLRQARRLIQESASTRTQLQRAITGDYEESSEWLPHGENAALSFRKVSPILLSLLYRENRTRRMYWARLLRVADAWEGPGSYLREERDGPLHTVSAWLSGNHFGLEWMRQTAGADRVVLKRLRSMRLRNGAIELALAARVRVLESGSPPATLEELEVGPHTRVLLELGEYRFERNRRTIVFQIAEWADPFEVDF